MTTTRSRRGRSLTAVLSAGALAVGTLALAAAPAQAAPAAKPSTVTGSGPAYVDDATFTWGISGYAQKGIFGRWRLLDATGNASFLTGSTQTEYVVAPVPATSMPASVTTNPNAVKLTAGTGVVDTATGAGKISWTGSYTTNAYPAQYGAPDEVYTDPVLTIAADGSGTLTAGFGLGEGVDMEGDPVEAADFGRLTIAEFATGSLSNKSTTGYRATPKYQGVTATLPEGATPQTTTCSTAGGATGWWGSWPQPFLTAISTSPVGASIAPHFYSTGCGGLQDNKPQLPIDVTFHAEPAPTVTVSNTRVNAAGQTVVTVDGTGFHAPMSIGTRPPLNAKPAGTYVAFGKFAESWRPSQGATSGNRKQVNGNPALTKWAVPAADLATIGGPGAGAVELHPDGTFSATVTIDKATLDAAAGAGTESFRYGIYTYGGSGAIAPAYETYTPITFLPVASTTTLDKTSYAGAAGAAVPVAVTVTGANEPEKATGTVTLSVTPEGGSATQVDSDTLGANGTVSLQLPADLAVGAGELTVSYAGDEIYGASTTTAAYAIGKKASAIQVVGPAAVGYRTTATYQATVTNGVGTVQVSGAGATVERPIVGGVATFSLPATLPAGSRTLRFTYAGADDVAAAAPVVKQVTVARGATVPAAAITSRWTARKVGRLVVTVRSVKGGPVPVGKVTVILKKGKVTKVRPARFLANGKVVVALPKSAKGRWTVRAAYAGSTQHLASTRTWTVKVPAK